MKNRLLLALAFGATTLGLSAQAPSKSDYTIISNLTSSKLTNADFSADAPISGVSEVCTYDYNMTAVPVGTADPTKGLFGMQSVTGWTASSPSDNIRVMETDKSTSRTDGANAKAAGIFAYLDDTVDDPSGVGLGGTAYLPPYLNDDAGTQGLGIVAVWGGAASYTQNVTLTAGAYMLVVKYYNTAGGEATNPNYNGFIADNGTQYLSSLTTFLPNSWQEDVIPFLLKEETSGKISLGYKSGNYGSGGAPHLFIDKVELYSIDPTPLQAAEIAAAKEELLALIKKGEDLGADVAASRAVYNNASATLEQVKEAIEKQKELNESATTDLSAYFIKNAHFTLGDALPEDNGICTYDYDMVDPQGSNGRKVDYYGMLDVNGWESSHPNSNARACGVFNVGSNSFLGGAAFLPPTTLSDGSTEGKVLGFVGVWTALSQYTQSVTLPKGKYTLRISYYNAGGTTAFTKNLMGFVENSGVEHLATTKQFSTLNKWLTEDITFELDEATPGYFTMGYEAANVGSGGMPHFFIDGFQIFYVGDLDFDPTLLALQAAVESGQSTLEENFNADLKDSFREVVDAGASLVAAQSDDAEANQAAYDAITDMLPEVSASVTAYKNLEKFYDETLSVATETYDEGTYADLNQTLLDMQDDVSEALQEFTWTTAQINEYIAAYDSIVIKGVKTAWDAVVASGEALDNDIDISILFEQLAYTYSGTAQSNTNVPDKEWQYGDATNFKTQYGTAEVWNQSPFKVFRTIKELPAGTYTITTKAFYRYSDQASNYDAYVTDPSNIPGAYVFAGNNKTQLVNVAEIASADESAFVNTSAVGDGLVVPNNQQAAHDVFENDDYTDIVQKSVSTVLTDAGDLTFGVSADGMEGNNWVVWYTFSVKYNAIDPNVLYDELQNLANEVGNYLEENEGSINEKVTNDTNEAIDGANNALTAGDIETMSAAITALQAAYEEAQKNATLMATLEEAYDEMSATADDYLDSTSKEAQDAYEAANDKYEEEAYQKMDNAELEAFIDEIKAATAALKIPAEAGEASDENPVDMTIAISTPSFEDEGTNSAAGWQNAAGSYGNNDTQKAALAYEYYNKQVDLYQDIFVPNGTYVLTVSAFYRPDASSTEAQDAQIYATSGEQTSSVLITYRDKEYSPESVSAGETELKEGEGEEATVVGYVPNDMVSAVAFFEAGYYQNKLTFKVTDGKARIGVKKTSNKSTDWVIMDNFRLTYFGEESAKEADKDLTGIESAEADAAAPAAIYTITGVKVASLQKGLNIVIDQNGKAKKVYVK